MITLNTARKIVKAINKYQGPMVLDNLISYVELQTEEAPNVIADVIEFLNECKGGLSTPPPQQQAVVVMDDKPLNLMEELEYNYKIAKVVLQSSLIDNRSIDPEETRKSLRTIANFMEQALKLQERLYNAQQLQKFQEAVLDTIANIDPVYRDTIIERLLNE